MSCMLIANMIPFVQYLCQNHCPGRTVSYLNMNRWSLRNNRLKFIETSGELLIISEEFIEEYTSNECKQTPEDVVNM